MTDSSHGPGAAAGDPRHGELVELVRGKAENLFAARAHLCAGAVLHTINESLGGGLDPEVASRLASGLPEGLGGAGCLCGALSGASLAVGLMIGDGTYKVPAWSRQLHDRFKQRFGSTCCRVLSKKTQDDPEANFQRCIQCTGEAAAIAADIILQNSPHLAGQADQDVLHSRTNRFSALIKRLLAATLS